TASAPSQVVGIPGYWKWVRSGCSCFWGVRGTSRTAAVLMRTLGLGGSLNWEGRCSSAISSCERGVWLHQLAMMTLRRHPVKEESFRPGERAPFSFLLYLESSRQQETTRFCPSGSLDGRRAGTTETQNGEWRRENG